MNKLTYEELLCEMKKLKKENKKLTEENKTLINENKDLKTSLKTFKKYAYKTGEIYRIEIKNTNFAYVGKTSQNTKTRFLQHTRDNINRFLKGVADKSISDDWDSLKKFLGDDCVILECLFFNVFDKHDDYPFPSVAIKEFFSVPRKKKGLEREKLENTIFDYVSVWRVMKVKYINEAVIFNLEGIQQEKDKKHFKMLNKRSNPSNTQDLELNAGLYKVKESLKQIF